MQHILLNRALIKTSCVVEAHNLKSILFRHVETILAALTPFFPEIKGIK